MYRRTHHIWIGTKDFWLIPDSFPRQTSKADMLTTDDEKASFGCPRRTIVPDKSSRIPFAPAESNRDRLKRWLREHFKSGTFNTCPHQPLKVMIGRPPDITFTREARPSAGRIPIPVPHHWIKRMKEDLNRFVALSIIEPVSAGTPTVWCSRMVVARKKDGRPRTVDLQKLNAATMRETHYTPSPFNQVSIVPARTKKIVLDA